MTGVEANGIFFNCRVDGPTDNPAAPWLVFSNSLATDLTLWDGQVERFADRFRILRYDTRGHGLSGETEPPYSFDMLTSDAIALMDAHGIDQAHWVGLSLGGSTGLGLALDYPDRIASLAVCDSRPHSDANFSKAWDDRIATVEAKGMDGVVETTIERWFTRPFRNSVAGKPVCDSVRAMIRKTAPEGFIGCSRALQTLSYKPRLRSISCRTLFMAGNEDSSCPPEVAYMMHKTVSGSNCVIIEPASHISNLENPAQFDAGLAAHLARAVA